MISHHDLFGYFIIVNENLIGFAMNLHKKMPVKVCAMVVMLYFSLQMFFYPVIVQEPENKNQPLGSNNNFAIRAQWDRAGLKTGSVTSKSTPCANIKQLGGQWQQVGKEFFIVSAYLDDRESPPYIRIMSIIRYDKGKDLFCKFTVTPSAAPVWTKIVYHEMCENHLMNYLGITLSCPLPANITVTPCQVEITDNSNNDASNNDSIFLPLQHMGAKQLPKKNIGVCVPPLYGDNVLKLVEFIEMSLILGADHIVLYRYNVSADVNRLLEYYAKRGVVSIEEWPLPWQLYSLTIWNYGQIVAVQDCLYKYMNTFNYLMFQDIDESSRPEAVVWVACHDEGLGRQ